MNVVIHNLQAMNAQRQYGLTGVSKKKSIEKLSSGYKINRAADDAAGLAISEKMRFMIRGLDQGLENTQDGVSFVQIGDGAMHEVTEMLQRINELVIQSANGTNSLSDRQAINREVQQLKLEIDRVSTTTVFNETRIFAKDDDREYYDIGMNISGEPADMEIFNATYDAAGNLASFGGIVYLGTRYTWNAIDPSMVTTDASGNMSFVGGTYTMTDSVTGHRLQFECQDGAQPPDIRRIATVTRGAEGICIDGELFDLNLLEDQSGNRISNNNYHTGTWNVRFNGMNIAINLQDEVGSRSEFFHAVNTLFDETTWTLECNYTHTNESVQAVDAQVPTSVRLSDSAAAQLLGNQTFAYRVNADANGISLSWGRDSGTGSTIFQQIPDSLMTWAELGISSWDSGRDISQDILYSYHYDDLVNNISVGFDFNLSDITSQDSVFDGMDGMILTGHNFLPQNSMSYDGTHLSPQLSNLQFRGTGNLTLSEEIAMDRDFDNRTVPGLSNAAIQVNGNDLVLDFPDALGNDIPTLHYQSSFSDLQQDYMESVRTYAAYVERMKTIAVLKGQNANAINLNAIRLESVLGENAITRTGLLSEPLTLAAGMKLTGDPSLSDGMTGFSGEIGSSYSSAKIDFSRLGDDYELDDLYGLGFNSTCQTCNNHYTIMFGSGTASRSSKGYAYTMKSQGDNYLLTVDIDSLRGKNVTNGEELAKALLDITDSCYDFHYTQYAAQGSSFYIYDNRTSCLDRRDAIFDTVPYYPIYQDEFSTTLTNTANPSRKIALTGTFDYSTIADKVEVEMATVGGTGDYVKNLDDTYSLYDPAKHDIPGVDVNGNPIMSPPAEIYHLKITHKNMAGDEVAGAEEMLNDYTDKTLRDIMSSISAQWNATDFVYGTFSGNEQPNTAVRAVFDVSLSAASNKKPVSEGVKIHHSSSTRDMTFIPRYKLGTNALHLTGLSALTEEKSLEAIGRVSYALSYISEKRSAYGAYQNRLEHTIAGNSNTLENLTASESRIRDTDMAKEMVGYAKHNILEQVGQSMIVQANQRSQGVLTLLG